MKHEDRHIYGGVENKTGLREIFDKICTDVGRADDRPAPTERYRRAGYLITLAQASSWEEKFGDKAQDLRETAEQEFRTTARAINRRTEQVGTEADYNEIKGGRLPEASRSEAHGVKTDYEQTREGYPREGFTAARGQTTYGCAQYPVPQDNPAEEIPERLAGDPLIGRPDRSVPHDCYSAIPIPVRLAGPARRTGMRAPRSREVDTHGAARDRLAGPPGRADCGAGSRGAAGVGHPFPLAIERSDELSRIRTNVSLREMRDGGVGRCAAPPYAGVFAGNVQNRERAAENMRYNLVALAPGAARNWARPGGAAGQVVHTTAMSIDANSTSLRTRGSRGRRGGVRIRMQSPRCVVVSFWP